MSLFLDTRSLPHRTWTVFKSFTNLPHRSLLSPTLGMVTITQGVRHMFLDDNARDLTQRAIDYEYKISQNEFKLLRFPTLQ